MTDGPDLTPDDHVARLEALLPAGAKVVKLVGFLGEEVYDGYHRLYADAALSTWIEIPAAQIVLRERIPAEHGELGGRSEIYVKAEAMRTPLRAQPEDGLEAEFLRASPDLQELVLETTVGDIAVQATLLENVSIACLTFRTCKR